MSKVDVSGPRGGITIDTDMLQDVLDRWVSMCYLAADFADSMEDCKYDIAEKFDTTELRHHAISDYTTELQQELRDLIADLQEVCVD